MFKSPGKPSEIFISSMTPLAFFYAGSHLLPKTNNPDLIGYLSYYIMKGQGEDGIKVFKSYITTFPRLLQYFLGKW